MKDNNSRVVLITGGTSGIGLATAKKFMELGEQVIVTGRNESKLNKVKEKYPNIDIVRADNNSSKDRKRLFTHIKEKYGRLNVMFANAGIGIFKKFEDITEEDFDTISDINYKGTFFMVQEAVKLMGAGDKVIINTSWTYLRGLQDCSLYSSTKAALGYLVKCLALELAEREISVNGISPGYINTEQFNEYNMPKEQAEYMKSHVPVQRFGNPEEIAEVVLMLAPNKITYLNGQDIAIDGGMTSVQI